jgi:hypothetical protein
MQNVGSHEDLSNPITENQAMWGNSERMMGIIIYSSKYIFTPENTETNKLQSFTALGYVRDQELYQGDMG